MLDGTHFRTYIVKADVWVNKTHHRDSQVPKGLGYTLNLTERVSVPTFLEAEVNTVGVSADADQTECPTGHWGDWGDCAPQSWGYCPSWGSLLNPQPL